MHSELKRDLMAALERSHRLGTIGGDLEEQLAHCASFSSVLAQIAPGEPEGEPVGRALDLGTGGGLPGLALACLWPESEWTLVDMRAARIDELERAILGLGLADRVFVRAIEAQRLAHEPHARERFDLVVARSFGQPSLTAECGSGFLRVGGHLIVSEPPTEDPDNSPRWLPDGLQALGFGWPRSVVVAPDHSVEGSQPAHFVVLTKERHAPDVVPRLPARPNRGWYTAN